MGDFAGHPFRGNQYTGAISAELDWLSERLGRSGLFGRASIVGSFANADPKRAPDRRGEGTSDIDLMVERTGGTARPVAEAWDELATVEREYKEKFKRPIHLNLEPVLGGAKSIELPLKSLRSASELAEKAGDREAARAIAFYTQSGYVRMNGVLRGEKQWKADDREEMGPKIATLDRAFKDYGTKLDADLEVTRGIQDGSGLFESLAPGTVFQDDGFTSTSIGNGGFTHRNIMLKITVPKGTQVLPVGGAEREVVLPRGGRYEVVGTEPSEGQVVYKVRRLP